MGAMLRTRFAPSPTGLLHVGNGYSALRCQQWSNEHNADLLLRIEDIDHNRCHERFTEALQTDLDWLGIRWSGQPLKQSDRLGLYGEALQQLEQMGAIYPCFCSRRKIRQEIAEMGNAPHPDDGPDPYPGTCKTIPASQRKKQIQNSSYAWRLDAEAAFRLISGVAAWQDGSGRSHSFGPSAAGDVIIGRRDIAFSYHLAVVVDDAGQHISHVIRGQDLLPVIPVHWLLQELLHLPHPVYIHHPLLLGNDGRRLAKRHGATTLRVLAESGINPERLQHYLLEAEPPVWPFSENEILLGAFR